MYDVPGHTGVGGTLSLTVATVATNSAGGGQLPGAGTRVDGDRLADDEAISNELADGLAGVGVGDLVDLVGVEPDLALAAVGDGGREALLGAKVDPVKGIMLVNFVVLASVANLLPQRCVEARGGQYRVPSNMERVPWCGKDALEV